MKVFLTQSMADLVMGRSFGPGEAEVPDRVAKEWIRAGVAQPIKRQKRTTTSVARANAEQAVSE